MNKKTVLYPLEVPAGRYCWEHKPPYSVCEHFDNDRSVAVCQIGFDSIIDTKEGVLKAAECFYLPDAESVKLLKGV